MVKSYLIPLEIPYDRTYSARHSFHKTLSIKWQKGQGVPTAVTKNPSETRKLGEKLAKIFLELRKERALVLALEGDLGGGKTTFLQGFARGLGIKEKILSPTFVLIKKYEARSTKKGNTRGEKNLQNFGLQTSYFYHIDCYRIKGPKEILDLGFKKIISGPKNIVAVEWADKIRKILPKHALVLKFEFIGKNKRKIVARTRIIS